MQPEDLVDPKPESDLVGPKKRIDTTGDEWRIIIQNWIFVLAVLSVIYGIGYLFTL